MIVVWPFLAVPWVCLQFVIVVFLDHTHLLFLKNLIDIKIKRCFLKQSKEESNNHASIQSNITSNPGHRMRK